MNDLTYNGLDIERLHDVKYDLIKSSNDKFDIYGFLINKCFQDVHIHEIYNNQAFEYKGSWIGGLGPHNDGVMTFPNDDIKIQAKFHYGYYIVEKLPLHFISINGHLSKEYFQMQNLCVSYKNYNNNNNDIKLNCLVQALSQEVKLARYDPNQSIFEAEYSELKSKNDETTDYSNTDCFINFTCLKTILESTWNLSSQMDLSSFITMSNNNEIKLYSGEAMIRYLVLEHLNLKYHIVTEYLNTLV